MRASALLVLLAGCHATSLESPAVQSSADAPFSLDDARVFLFSPSNVNNDFTGTAVLIVATGDQTCLDLAQPFDEVRTDALAEGHGVLLTLSYQSWGATQIGTNAFAGFYASGGAESVTERNVTRSLAVSAFDEGWLFNEGYYSNSWMRVDSVGDRVQGEFATEYWHGSFDAEQCGEWSPGDTWDRQDTGWNDTSPNDTSPWYDTSPWIDTGYYYYYDTGERGFDPANDTTVRWEIGAEGGLTASLANCDATGFALGMAETAAGFSGWYGEDCLDGGDCHEFDTITAASLAYVEAPEDVVLGATTLFDSESAFSEEDEDRLTYMIRLRGGSQDGFCFVWGEDPSYYASLGCQVL